MLSPSSTGQLAEACLFAIAHKLNRPIRYVGVGEQSDDLRDFVARDFVSALLDA